MTIYRISVPDAAGGEPVDHTVEADTPPHVVDGQGLTFTLAGVIQAPSPFPQWCSCVQVTS